MRLEDRETEQRLSDPSYFKKLLERTPKTLQKLYETCPKSHDEPKLDWTECITQYHAFLVEHGKSEHIKEQVEYFKQRQAKQTKQVKADNEWYAYFKGQCPAETEVINQKIENKKKIQQIKAAEKKEWDELVEDIEVDRLEWLKKQSKAREERKEVEAARQFDPKYQGVNEPEQVHGETSPMTKLAKRTSEMDVVDDSAEKKLKTLQGIPENGVKPEFDEAFIKEMRGQTMMDVEHIKCRASLMRKPTESLVVESASSCGDLDSLLPFDAEDDKTSPSFGVKSAAIDVEDSNDEIMHETEQRESFDHCSQPRGD